MGPVFLESKLRNLHRLPGEKEAQRKEIWLYRGVHRWNTRQF